MGAVAKMARDRRDPAELTVPEAAGRFVKRKRGRLAEATYDEYVYRLRRLSEWCEEVGIDRVGDLHPLDFDDFLAYREDGDVKRVTLNKHFGTIREFIKFCESLGAVQDDLHEAVPDIKVPDGAEINETMLDPDDGDALLRFYRQSDEWYGSRQHAVMEIFWFVGCRLGALRALDLGDFDPNDRWLAFEHRPDTDTPLKNKADGERVVALIEATAEALRHYVDRNRHEVRDEYGRQPLITSQQGRPAINTIRVWSYKGTVPCIRTDCPHGEKRPTCEYLDHNHASKCPSSRSPHQVRTGATTRMLNKWPKERVANRVNTREFPHYDQEDEHTKMEERERDFVDDLELDDEDGQSDGSDSTEGDQ